MLPFTRRCVISEHVEIRPDTQRPLFVLRVCGQPSKVPGSSGSDSPPARTAPAALLIAFSRNYHITREEMGYHVDDEMGATQAAYEIPHRRTRSGSSIEVSFWRFDTSHLGRIRIHGPTVSISLIDTSIILGHCALNRRRVCGPANVLICNVIMSNVAPTMPSLTPRHLIRRAPVTIGAM